MKLQFGKSKKALKNKGKFIVIDGTDGSGKTTQANLLVATLKQEGFNVELADFPQYGTKSAGAVEEYLNGKYGQVNPYAASVLYAVDRFDASFKIRQWLDQGKIIVSNRYVTANAGHQGAKIPSNSERVKYFKWLDNFEYGLFGIPKPDLNIILHVPAKLAQKLVAKKPPEQRKYVNGKKHDLHEKDLAHLRQAEQVYLQITELFPNTKLVECFENNILLAPQQIHNKVWQIVWRMLLKK